MTQEDAAENLDPVPTPEQHEAPSTLHALLMALTQADDDMQETLQLDQQSELIEAGRIKVDSYKYLLDKLEAQEAMLDKWVQEYLDARRAIQNNRKRLIEHLTFALRSNGFDKFTGNQYVVSLRKAPPSVEVKGEPTAGHKLKYSEFVRTKYEWDKTAIRDALKAGNESAAELAALKETVYPKFTVLKGI